MGLDRVHPFVVCALIVVVAGLGSVVLGPEASWDYLNYHIYAPYALLHDRYGFDIAPAQVQTFFNPTASLILYGLVFSDLNAYPRVIAFIMGALHGVNAVLVFALARFVISPADQVQRDWLTLIATIIGVTGTGYVSLLGMGTGDLVTSIFILGALLAALQGAYSAETSRYAAFCGVLLGIGVGLKYTSAIFAPGIGLIVLYTAFRRRSWSAALAFCALSAVAFALSGGHHLYRMWTTFGNPVFPFANHIFQSPYWELIRLRNDDRFLPRDTMQKLFYPFYWTVKNSNLVAEPEFREWRGAITYIAVVVGALACGLRTARRATETRGLGFVLAFVLLSYLAWLFLFGIYRYGVAIEMLTGIVAVGVLIWLFRAPAIRITLSVAILVVAVTTTKFMRWGRLPSYGDAYLSVKLPPLPKNGVVLLYGSIPTAYLVPFADPSTRFVGINSNILLFDQSNKQVAEIKQLMANPDLEKFVLNHDSQGRERINEFLIPAFKLQLDATTCAAIVANVGPGSMSICRLVPSG